MVCMVCMVCMVHKCFQMKRGGCSGVLSVEGYFIDST